MSLQPSSFAFSPDTLLLDINRQIVAAQSEVDKFQNTIDILLRRLNQFTGVAGDAAGRERTLIQRGLNIFNSRLGNATQELQSLVNTQSSLNEEITFRSEIFQPTNVDLDTGVLSTGIEELKKEIDLKTLALIGGAIVLLS